MRLTKDMLNEVLLELQDKKVYTRYKRALEVNHARAMFAYNAGQFAPSSLTSNSLNWSGALDIKNGVLEAWLKQRGLRFDPFAVLNAVEDSRLSRYFVEHEVFSRLWGAHPFFLFAPPGGGKSALRCQVVQTCWIGSETNRPFPIPYLPPYLGWSHVPPSWEQHLAALARSAAKALLAVLAYRPHWSLRLSAEQRTDVARALDLNLPRPLAEYLQALRDTCSPDVLVNLLGLDYAYYLPDAPHSDAVRTWCDVWPRVAAETDGGSPLEKWEMISHVILEVFRFEGMYILLDGLDAAPETGGRDVSTSARTMVQILLPLLQTTEKWAEKRIYLKGFLPVETQDFLQSLNFASLSSTARLSWSAPALIHLVQRRLYVASEGSFDSLSALAAPGLSHIEEQLTDCLMSEKVLLPREMLVLTRRLFVEHVARADVPYIEPEDIERAINWYRTYSPGLGVPLI